MYLVNIGGDGHITDHSAYCPNLNQIENIVKWKLRAFVSVCACAGPRVNDEFFDKVGLVWC